MQDIKIQNQIQPQAGIFSPGEKTRNPQSISFGKLLQESINQVNRLQVEADTSANDLATGKQTDIHQTMIAVEKAEVSFELLMQIRNKVIAAYESIMRTQI
jgi:flagellar hook-basal body complex protein FliE